MRLPHLRGRCVGVEVLYPRHLATWTCDWNPDAATLTVTPTDNEPAAARLFRITHKEAQR
jgi:hypothetical protein